LSVIAAGKPFQIGEVPAAFAGGVLSRNASELAHFLARPVLFPMLRDRE